MELAVSLTLRRALLCIECLKALFHAGIVDAKELVLRGGHAVSYTHLVELLSRFRSPKQQEQILRKLRRGEVDIIIGTHRLLQKDVQFKDLGLCIIDEEQRFGVAHKEKFKEMRESVDVLTLSATPIPRTLNMACLLYTSALSAATAI